MIQEALFKDLLSGRLAAIGADIDAVGAKEIGLMLWPDMPVESAQRKISNNLNPKQRHEFSDGEVWLIRQRARKETGRSHLHEYESGLLNADLHWVTAEEHLDRKEQKLESLLEMVHAEFREWKEAKAAIK